MIYRLSLDFRGEAGGIFGRVTWILSGLFFPCFSWTDHSNEPDRHRQFHVGDPWGLARA